MSARDDGGPAFPEPWTNDGDRNATAPDGQLVPPQSTVHMRGMSLRDYFAAHSLPLIVMWAPLKNDPESVSEGATLAYQFADAMLEARRK
jgi:hypothetical protein